MEHIGLAETAQVITSAPKEMFVEVEQDEDVARGCVKVTEIIAYDATKEPRRYSPEKAGGVCEIRKDGDGNILYVEVGREPYFCQDPELVSVFTKNNPDARIETFTIQLRKSIAMKHINSPRNMAQFKKKE